MKNLLFIGDVVGKAGCDFLLSMQKIPLRETVLQDCRQNRL